MNDALETAGPGLDLDATDAVADRFDGAVVLYVVSTVLVFVSLAVFLRQAYVAAQRLGVRELRYSPTWALLGWLVPVMALWVPKRIVDDVWRSANARDSSWTVKDTPGLVTVWWTGVIVTLFASRVAFSNPLLLRLFTILDVLVALLGIAVVLGITRRLASRAAALGSPMKDGDLMAARAPAGAPGWTVPVLAVAASVLLLSGTAAATIQGAELPAGAEGSPAAVADPAPTSPPPRAHPLPWPTPHRPRRRRYWLPPPRCPFRLPEPPCPPRISRVTCATPDLTTPRHRMPPANSVTSTPTPWPSERG